MATPRLRRGARGTGYAEPTSVYDKRGTAYPATALRIVEGPELPKMPGWRNQEAIREHERNAPKRYPLLIDEKGNILALPDVRPGTRIRVRGAMSAGGYAIRGPQNQKVSQFPTSQPVTEWAIQAGKVQTIPPDN